MKKFLAICLAATVMGGLYAAESKSACSECKATPEQILASSQKMEAEAKKIESTDPKGAEKMRKIAECKKKCAEAIKSDDKNAIAKAKEECKKIQGCGDAKSTCPSCGGDKAKTDTAPKK